MVAVAVHGTDVAAARAAEGGGRDVGEHRIAGEQRAVNENRIAGRQRTAGKDKIAGQPRTAGTGHSTPPGGTTATDPADLATGDRAWPVAGPAGIRPTVLRGWQPPPTPWAAGHRGVDLASSVGTTVRAAAPGRVAYAGTVAGRGVLTIEVSRSSRPPLHTTYEPVRATVRTGERVTAGQPVATLQSGPFHCRAPCLHWGLRRGKAYLDPLTLLPRSMRSNGHSRLLPIFGVPLPTGGHPDTGRPSAAAHESQSAPTGVALTGAVGLAVAALWALGRLSPDRTAAGGRKQGKVCRGKAGAEQGNAGAALRGAGQGHGRQLDV
ncbi:M23 family metallopeptidase [Streptomyces sp. NPDC048506]|uniref:murein hydrolase activator EnvC family protein n=1 Tax=Streptomyces sp. NPDC048506 TaxID=3155028 RepID=UPI003436DC8E